MLLIDLGNGHSIQAERILLILAADYSEPQRRLKDDADRQKRLINLTRGAKAQSLILTDSNHVILCALPPERFR